MRVSKLRSRYFLAGLTASAVLCSGGCSRTQETSGYQTVPLVQGAKSFGRPLAGIAIEANGRDVYAIVGRESAGAEKADFVILWKSKDGPSYRATISDEKQGIDSISEVMPDGKTKLLQLVSRNSPETNGGEK